MSANGPTLLAAREALAALLRGIDLDDDVEYAGPYDSAVTGLSDTGAARIADALLASGVVQTPASFVAGLAGDEALVERVWKLAPPRIDHWNDVADVFRALAAALGGAE